MSMLLLNGSIRRDAASSCLQCERKQVAAYEANSVDSRLKAREMCAIGDDDAREAEIDGSAEKDGPDGQAYQIP